MASITLKTALITGCSDLGIGSGLALALQKHNIHVFATARNVSKMGNLASLPNVTLLELDVTSSSDIATAMQTVSSMTGGKLDYLINNAGRNHFSPVLDEDIAKVRGVWEINVAGPLAITQAFAPLVIEAKGMMVFVTSIAGHSFSSWMGSYSATKRSLEIIAETLRLEIAPFNVSVLSIVTGAVLTQGQSYFEEFALPANSRYKVVEDKVRARAQGTEFGKAGLHKMSLEEYSSQAVKAILGRECGKVWLGAHAEDVRMATAPAVGQDVLDAAAGINNGLDHFTGGAEAIDKDN